MADLRTDFKDDIYQGNRRYIMTQNEDGTVSFSDATQYEQRGDYFGANDINNINKEVNNKADKTEIPIELPAKGGDADTVNGHTVNADVPANAKFTDTLYTHPDKHPASIINQDTNNRFVSDSQIANWNGKANGSHTHPASQITAGTLPVGVLATNSTDYTTSRPRNIRFGTTDPTSLANGELHFTYEV